MLISSRSIGPSTCGVFLSRVEVFLEGGMGQKALSFIAPRGPSRFGQVNCWIDGEPPAAVLPDELEKADFFVLVGLPQDLYPRLAALRHYLERESSITAVITAGTSDEVNLLKETGLTKPAVIALSPESSPCCGLVLDSLTALNYYYENALGRFSLFDLKYLWPDGIRLEVKHYRWLKAPTEQGTQVEAFQLTDKKPDLLSPHLLAVLRGPSALSEGEIQKMLEMVFAPQMEREAVFWYAVGQPPSAPDEYEALVFSAGADR